MSESKGFYEVYDYGDNLRFGDRMKIERHISSRDDGTRLAQLTHMSAEKLAGLYDESCAKEKAVFEKLCAATGEWAEQAAQTMLLEDAIEYVKTPPVKHNSNQWEPGEYNWCECSNMVYKMTYYVREDTQLNPATRKHDMKVWVVSWNLHYNFPQHNSGGGHIAGQDNKKFTEKEKADNYIIGRIAAHASYFQELSPPVPKNLAWKFSRNHQLLPGYKVQGEAPPAIEAPVPVKAAEPAPAKETAPIAGPAPAAPADASPVAGMPILSAPQKVSEPAAPINEPAGPVKEPAKTPPDAGTDYSRFIRSKTHKPKRAARGGEAR